MKTTAELRKLVKDLETKTVMLDTTENHILHTMVSEKEEFRKLKDSVDDQISEIEKLKQRISELVAQNRVLKVPDPDPDPDPDPELDPPPLLR